MTEEPKFIEPDYAQKVIFHRWRAAWISEQVESLEVTRRSFERLRAENQRVGNESSLNMYVEAAVRHRAMLFGWRAEELELERQARVDHEHWLKTRKEESDG